MTNIRSNAYYINEVIDSGILASVSPAHGQVYIAYVRYSNGGVNDAFLSQEKLSSNLGIDVRTIRRAIRNLADLGYIKQVSSGKGKGSKKSNLFTVMMPSQLGFPKKSATQAPVPLAPVPTPTNQPKPQPAPAAAPASMPVLSVPDSAPILPDTLPSDVPDLSKFEVQVNGITPYHVIKLMQEIKHHKLSVYQSPDTLDRILVQNAFLNIDKARSKLWQIWEELQEDYLYYNPQL